jgi:hypothetical protein
MANRRFIDFPIAASVGNNDIVLIWQDGLNKQTTKATLLQGSPSSLAGLTDVDIAGLNNGQILQYNSTTSKWENVDRTDINLSELGDVTIVAPANGQVLVYNSSTSKWENSSAGYVPYTGAVTTVNLGAQSILAGSFVKAGGTSAQFLKADGSVDSSTYGTGTVTSVALTMPTAFSVANSPITTTGTLAVTATGTTAQYIRGDGSLATFPGLTGFVPYTGATADVNLGTHDLAAERGTFANNGSSDTLTVNHTSGSGYGIIVTKGGANEALYVSKTSGSGNAMTVVGGRTSLVDLALSSVTNTAGDFLTLSGGVVHKRTAAQTLTDIGGQAALTNPVTGTGTTNYLPKFTGSTTIGNSNLINDASGNLGLGVTPSAWASGYTVAQYQGGFLGSDGTSYIYFGQNAYSDGTFKYLANGLATIYAQDAGKYIWYQAPSGTAGNAITFTQAMTLTSGGNLLVGTPTDQGQRLLVQGTGGTTGFTRFTDGVSAGMFIGVNSGTPFIHSNNSTLSFGATGANTFSPTMTLSSGNVGIGTTIPVGVESNDLVLQINGNNTEAMRSMLRFTNGNSGTTWGNGVFMTLDSSLDFYFYNSENAATIFGTNGSERMRITSGGNVLIGTTTDSGGKLRVEGDVFINNSSNAQIGLNTTGALNSVGAYLYFNRSGSNKWTAGMGPYTGGNNYEIATGSVVALSLAVTTGTATFGSLGTGSVTATAGTLSTVSDFSYKIDDGYIDSAIEKVLNLKPRYFYWNEKSGLPKNIRQLGFYAQEVNEALGEEAANTPQNENTPWGISDRSIIAMLTKAIQEQQEIINDLKQKIS